LFEFTGQILVRSMWPLYGPIAGGTRVTITGQSLDAITDVLFGEHRQNPDTSRLLLLSLNSSGSCLWFMWCTGVDWGR